MLEKPDIEDSCLVASLQDGYGLHAIQVSFLPLGADQHTASYRVLARDQTPYFLKVRRGAFDEASVALPHFLRSQGVTPIIAPLTTKAGQLWAGLGSLKLVLYPFVEGENAYGVALSERHWHDLGKALKRIHTVELPPAIIRVIQPETYSPEWREMTRGFLERVEDDTFDDPIAAELAVFLKAQRAEVLNLVGRAEQLAGSLQARSQHRVLCHGDLHPGNILIDASNALFIVDWDSPVMAPQERDLMFFGGGLGFAGYAAQEEEALFYRGYGPTPIDPTALAYYRYERIVQDIAAFCQQLLLTNEGGPDRERSLGFLTSNFLPKGTIAMAHISHARVEPIGASEGIVVDLPPAPWRATCRPTRPPVLQWARCICVEGVFRA